MMSNAQIVEKIWRDHHPFEGEMKTAILAALNAKDAEIRRLNEHALELAIELNQAVGLNYHMVPETCSNS